MRTFATTILALALCSASRLAAQDEIAAGPQIDAGMVTQFADQLETQAEQAASVADQIAAAAPSEVPEMLRQAELNGVGSAWYARRRISNQTIGSTQRDQITVAERNEAVALLRKQSESLATYSTSLTEVATEAGGDNMRLRESLSRLLVPDAALIVRGSPGAPSADREAIGVGEAAAPTDTAQVLIAGPAGTATNDYPSVGAVVIRRVNSIGTARTVVDCTGTLVSPRVVLTAAHCLDRGATPVSVFFQHAGNFPVATFVIREGFRVQDSGQPINDLAVLQLESPVLTIRPAAVADPGTLQHGSEGTIVGFGYRNHLDPSGNAIAGSPLLQRTGLKLAGIVETRLCNGISGLTVTDQRICWEFKGEQGATVCSGDSGGPLFVRRDAQWFLAGVTSFGLRATSFNPCPASSIAVDTDISAHRPWLSGQIASLDPDAASPEGNALHPVLNGTDRFLVAGFEQLAPATTTVNTPLPVKAGAGSLFVGVNGSPFLGPNQAAVRTTLELIDPQGLVVCRRETLEALAHCGAQQPVAGDWSIRLSGSSGQEIQLTALAY